MTYVESTNGIGNNMYFVFKISGEENIVSICV